MMQLRLRDIPEALLCEKKRILLTWWLIVL